MGRRPPFRAGEVLLVERRLRPHSRLLTPLASVPGTLPGLPNQTRLAWFLAVPGVTPRVGPRITALTASR
jgi:hypothetical protein